MTEKSLEKALGDKPDNQLKEQVTQAHEKYRQSGMALMTTVTTLSAGGLILPIHFQQLSLFFMLYWIPLSLALFQGLHNYLGGQKYARFMAQMDSASFYMAVDNIDRANEEIQKAAEFRRGSDKVYGRADNLCVIMVWAFVVVTIVIIMRIALSRRPGLIASLFDLFPVCCHSGF